MKKLILTLQVSLCFIATGSVLGYDTPHQLISTHQNEIKMDTTTIQINVDSETFTVSLSDNEATEEFLKMLPMELRMEDLNQNEKYADLLERLPTQTYVPETIENGDLMLFGSQTLVLFYKTFSTSYKYTKLGAIDDPEGLATALGKGAVKITFER